MRQVGEGDAVEHAVDALLEQPPHRPDAARGLRATSPGVDRMEIAVDFEGDALGGLHHVLHGDGLRLARQEVPAPGSAHGLDQAGAPQAEEDLLNVVVRQPFLSRDFACRRRAAAGSAGEMHGNDQAVFGPRREAHRRNMPERRSRFNAARPSPAHGRPPSPPIPPFYPLSPPL